MGALTQRSLQHGFPGLSSPEETLFCYTDGVTEAHNAKGEEFTEQRCLQMLDGLLPLPSGDLLDHVRAQVADFTGTDLLEDDCTMLARRLP